MLKRFFHAAARLVRRLSGNPEGTEPLPELTRRYIAWNRQKWPQDYSRREDAVVLASLFDWKPSIHCFAYAANHLGRLRKARPAAFYFGNDRDPALEPLFASFGANLELTWPDAEPFRARAEAIADEFAAAPRTRWELLDFTIDGLKIGDLIYDSYLRNLGSPTVRMDDPKLRDLVRDAALVYFATKQYFADHRVVAVLADDSAYLNCGMVVRVAGQHQITSYIVYYDPSFYLAPMQNDETGRPIRSPWFLYRKMFAELPSDIQAAGRARGRAALQARLGGDVQSNVLPGQSAFEAKSAERLLADTPTPKILVMLHDFCDAVHIFRHSLFEDFYEWIYFLLARASETPFEWYIKPHPNARVPFREAMNQANTDMNEELKKAFPKVRFVSPGASNLQLIEQGIQALFTVHGTAGHEFAYLGIPVVNAGDNPHIAYDFDYHPRTVEEYAGLIATADELVRPNFPEQIEEYHFMNYYHLPDWRSSGVKLMDLPPVPDGRFNTPETLAMLMAGSTPEREAQIAAYFQKYFAAAADTPA